MKDIGIILFVCVISLASCISPRYVYSPSPPNNPYFTEKGQSKLTAYYSSGEIDNALQGEKNNGFDIQGAYAIGDNWALTTGYFFRNERNVYTYDYNFFDSSTVSYKRGLADIGGGYFLPLNKKRNLSFNFFTGLALGKFSFNDNGVDKSGADYSRFHRSNIVKWYIQPSFNILPGKYFRASVITKFSWVHYGNISTSYTHDELQYFYLDRIKNITLFFIEPTYNMQVGIPKCEWLKIDGGVTFTSYPYSSASYIQSRNFNASIGLSFDFSKLKK